MNNIAAFAETIHAALAVQGVTGELVVIVGKRRMASWIGQPNDGDSQCVVTVKPLYRAEPEHRAHHDMLVKELRQFATYENTVGNTKTATLMRAAADRLDEKFGS